MGSSPTIATKIVKKKTMTINDTFNSNVDRMVTMLCYNMALDEIHATFVDNEGMSEEDFFLLYHAAKILVKSSGMIICH